MPQIRYFKSQTLVNSGKRWSLSFLFNSSSCKACCCRRATMPKTFKRRSDFQMENNAVRIVRVKRKVGLVLMRCTVVLREVNRVWSGSGGGGGGGGGVSAGHSMWSAASQGGVEGGVVEVVEVAAVKRRRRRNRNRNGRPRGVAGIG
mgnify:CR=1 FL=1